jgi:predicted DCC family thiol-disulfide oxidoreductase YuxK
MCRRATAAGPMDLRAHLKRTYLSLDPRSLGAFRISFAAVLLLDLALRYVDVDVFYTNDGLLPNHTMLWAPITRRLLSFFFMAPTPAEARLGMALCAVVFSLLLIGYRTKLMQVLSWICLMSLNTRLGLLENGGDIVLNNMATWTLFLPLGKRFSVDAVLASLRARDEHAPEELNERAALRPSNDPVVSLAALGVIVQIAAIYFFNAVHKVGDTWRQGTAVHYTMHQDRIITVFGVWLREHAPSSLFVLLTHATTVAELAGAILILSPIWPQRARLLALIALPVLHIGFALCLNLGTFSYVMASLFPILIAPQHWDFLRRKAAARGPRLFCFFDAECGVCFQIARVFARLDVFDRIEFVANRELERLPHGVTAELVERTLVVQDRGTGVVYTRAHAVSALCRALPLGVVPWLVLELPLLSSLWGWLYDKFAQNRPEISAWFGLAVCGLPAPAGVSTVEEPLANGPARLRARLGHFACEAGAAIMLIAAIGEATTYNAAVPQWMHYPQPDPLQALIDYGRLIQSWRMFAPDAPLDDMTISIEATTADGRVVDPFNEVAGRYKHPLDSVPPALGYDQFFTTYALIIPTPRCRPYLGALEQWILNYPERTGRNQDRIVKFTAYVITDLSPPPGQTEPHDTKKTPFLEFPHER